MSTDNEQGTVGTPWEQARKYATDRYDLKIWIPGRLYGGMPNQRSTLEKMPWKERSEALRNKARELSEQSLPMDDTETPTQTTVFRRTPEGGLALSANQIRTFLQEAAANMLTGDPGYFVLRRAIRNNIVLEPTLIPLFRKGTGAPLEEPQGIDFLPRTIRRPPFERSIEAQPEFVEDVTFAFRLFTAGFGSGRSFSKDIFEFLFSSGTAFIGLGSHRGLDDKDPGKGVILEFNHTVLQKVADIVPRIPGGRATARKAPVAKDDEDRPEAVVPQELAVGEDLEAALGLKDKEPEDTPD